MFAEDEVSICEVDNVLIGRNSAERWKEKAKEEGREGGMKEPQTPLIPSVVVSFRKGAAI